MENFYLNSNPWYPNQRPAEMNSHSPFYPNMSPADMSNHIWLCPSPRPADTSSHISLYPSPRPADLSSHIPLMNAQMRNPLVMRREGYSNQHSSLMSPPIACGMLQNSNDSNLFITLSTGSLSSGDSFSTPTSANDERPWNVYGSCSPLSLGESFGKSSFSSATRSPSSLFAVTPVKMEEDVLVMDEIMVGNAQGARSRAGRDSSGSSGRSYKAEVCRSWAETGSCRYGLNCQFLHTKEVSSPTRYLIKSKLDYEFSHIKEDSTPTKYSMFYSLSKPDTEIGLPESPFGPFRSPHSSSLISGLDSSPTMSHRAVAYGRSPFLSGSGPATIAEDSNSSDSGSKATSSRQAASPATIYPDWSPMDDGIDVKPPGSVNKPPQSREEISAYIDDFLHAPHVMKRLPVFTSLCPDDDLRSHDDSVDRSPSSFK